MDTMQTQQTFQNGDMTTTVTTTTVTSTPDGSLLTRAFAWVKHNYTLVIFVVIVLILVEILWGFGVVKKWQNRQDSRALLESTPVAVTGLRPTFSFATTTLTLKNGQETKTEILIDTAGQNTDAATAVITYDPKMFAIVAVTPGTTYEEYAKPIIDAGKGRIVISGLMNGKAVYTGSGTFAFVTVKAIAKGTTNFNFDYRPGATDETTIAGNGTELLQQAQGMQVTIQ